MAGGRLRLIQIGAELARRARRVLAQGAADICLQPERPELVCIPKVNPPTGDDYCMRSIGKDDPAVLDPSALNMRVATFGAGVWLSYFVCATSTIYIILTWQLPNRTALAVLFGAGIAAAAVVAQLPRERIVRSRFREAFFLAWSLLDLALIALAALADGGTGSPVALVFFIPVVFAAMSYPLWSVALVGGLTVASYLTLAVTVGGAPWAYQATFAAMLTCTGAMSAWQARNHARQSQVLMHPRAASARGRRRAVRRLSSAAPGAVTRPRRRAAARAASGGRGSRPSRRPRSSPGTSR